MNPDVICSQEGLSKLSFETLAPTDCTFVFDGEEIKAHRLILRNCSPVFEKMFFGNLASNRIVITDITLEDFSYMLEFIYTNSVRIKSILHAWSLIYVAHKYLLDSFAETCVAYISENFAIHNLVLNYEYAEMFGIEHLQNLCLLEIQNYIRGLFIKVCDYHMKSTSLIKILQQKHLNITNNELIIGVLRWAVTECDIKSINVSTENVINLLKSQNVLQFLTDLEFNVNSYSDVLILQVLHVVKSLKNTTIPYRTYLKEHWVFFCKCRQVYKISGRIELRERDMLVSNISVNRNVLLYGLVVVTENEQLGNNQNQYSGIIKIQVNKVKNSKVLTDTIFYENLLYENLVYVPLANVIYLERETLYSIKISYKNLSHFVDLGIGKSSILCNYMSNKLIDKNRNIVFSFEELNGSVIRGISYYPA